MSGFLSVNFMKFLRVALLQNNSIRLLLKKAEAKSYYIRSQKQSPRGFFTGKHLSQSLFLLKFQAKACNFFKKESLEQVFSCEIYEIFENSFSL